MHMVLPVDSSGCNTPMIQALYQALQVSASLGSVSEIQSIKEAAWATCLLSTLVEFIIYHIHKLLVHNQDLPKNTMSQSLQRCLGHRGQLTRMPSAATLLNTVPMKASSN